MVERRCRLRFALESAASGRVGEFRGEKLDGNGAIELRVDGAIDGPHAAFAEHALDSRRPNLRAGGEIHAVVIR